MNELWSLLHSTHILFLDLNMTVSWRPNSRSVTQTLYRETPEERSPSWETTPLLRILFMNLPLASICVLCIHFSMYVSVHIFDWSCKVQCAQLCRWDMVLQKWPRLLLSSSVLWKEQEVSRTAPLSFHWSLPLEQSPVLCVICSNWVCLQPTFSSLWQCRSGITFPSLGQGRSGIAFPFPGQGRSGITFPSLGQGRSGISFPSLGQH